MKGAFYDHTPFGIQEAILASDFAGFAKVIRCYFDSFFPIKIDKKEVKKLFSSKEKELTLLKIGESIEV